MGATLLVRLLRTFISGRNSLSKVLGHLLRHAGAKVLEKMAFLASILRVKWAGREEVLPRGSVEKPGLSVKSMTDNTFFFNDQHQQDSNVDLTLVTNGETISMDNVACSSYPSSSTPANRFSTSWTQLHFRPHTETIVSEARSTSTVIEMTEFSSRWESNITSKLILSQAGTTTFFNHPRIMPMMPEASRRYKQRSSGDNRKFNSQLATDSAKHPLSAGWVQCTHPEGGIYFSNKEKRIFTDANIYDTTIYQQMLEDISTIEEFISTHNITLPKNCDLALDVNYNNACQEIQTRYYFVHHPSRSIFFLDNHEAPWCEFKGINSSSHLREELEAQYWLYLQLYPQALEISSALIFELRDTVLQFIGDYMSSQVSATIYNLDELYKILTLIDNLEKNTGRESNGAVGLLSRLMHSFAQSRVYDSHGEIQTRLKNEVRVVTYATQATKRTWFIRIVSPFMFSTPNLYLRTLRRMWVIGSTHTSVWDQGVTRLRHEWREFIFWSILMLIANAAFLGIRDIGLRHQELKHRSGAQISSYVSVIFAIGSIFLGMVFHEHILSSSRDLIGDVSAYTAKRAYSLVGLEARAIVYSLPYVFLVWSVIAFATASGFLFFQDATKVTRIVVGTLGAVVAVLVVVGIYTSWERYSEQEPAASRPKAAEKATTAEV